jgi:hypothetical protein
MRNAPMRWIEQAEARDVLASALFESEPMPSRYRQLCTMLSERFSALRGVMVQLSGIGGPLLQLEPALVRPAAGRREAHCREDEGYPSSW